MVLLIKLLDWFYFLNNSVILPIFLSSCSLPLNTMVYKVQSKPNWFDYSLFQKTPVVMATSVSVITRKCLRCPIFGAPRDLPDTMLPTFEDIMKYYLYVRNDLKVIPKSNGPIVSEESEIVWMLKISGWRRPFRLSHTKEYCS